MDAADLQMQLREWLIDVNNVRPSRATRVILSVRLAEERPRPRPVKVAPADLALRIPIGRGFETRMLAMQWADEERRVLERGVV